MLAPHSHNLLDVLDNWVDAQSEGICNNHHILRRPPGIVELKILVSAGPRFRTSRYVAAEECSTVSQLLKTTWDAVQEEIKEKTPGNRYKWWEGVLLIGNSSLETKQSRRQKLLGMNGEHQKTWLEWRHRNLEGGYCLGYTVGVAFGVSHGKRKL